MSIPDVDREGGFIVLHRRIESWPLFRSLNAEQRYVVITLLLSANWQPGSFWYGTSQIHVGRGELAHSEETIAKRAGASRKVVRGVLSKLEAEGFLSRKKVHPAGQCPHVITIKNYDQYQKVDDKPGPRTGQSGANDGPMMGPDRTRITSGTMGNGDSAQAPTPPLARSLVDLWQQKHGQAPTWGKADYVALAKLAKQIDADEIQRRFVNYLSTDKPYFAGHSLRKFCAAADEFIVGAVRNVRIGSVPAESHEEFRKRGGGVVPW